MTIYYSLTFLLLASEMVTFCVLVAPLPRMIKRNLFNFLSTSVVVAKIAYGLKISFIFVAILFADALQRMFRISAESDIAKTQKQGTADVRTETNLAARKFYAQRNVYLTGFTLFLSLVLTRTFYIILDLIQTQEAYTQLQQTAASGDSKALKLELEKAKKTQRDFDILKKQAAQNGKEYDRLATELNDLTGSKSDKRAD